MFCKIMMKVRFRESTVRCPPLVLVQEGPNLPLYMFSTMKTCKGTGISPYTPLHHIPTSSEMVEDADTVAASAANSV